MAQFATAQELADRLGDEFTSAEEARADGLLAQASGLVQSAGRQVIALVEDETLTMRGSRETAILLPQRPVVSIASITLDGEALAEGTDWWLEGDRIVRRCGWGCDRDELVVVYTHGYADIPDAIKGVVLGATARVWVNPNNIMSERLGQAQLTYAQDTPVGLLLTDAERRTVRQVVSRGSESLPVR